MKIKMIGAVAALFCAMAAPAMADTDVCGFVKAAVADTPNNFKSFAGDADHGIKPDLVPDHADSCGVGEGDQHFVGCFWVLPKTNQPAAAAMLGSLSGRVGACLGSGYQSRNGQGGGAIFSDAQSNDRVATSLFQDKDGAWEVYLMVIGAGLAR
jgi:hypothetical protein